MAACGVRAPTMPAGGSAGPTVQAGYQGNLMAVRVVVIRSLSYTGTTWVNLLLSSHPRTLYLGPPERIWRLPREEADQACLKHRGACPLWKPFVSAWDRSGGFFRQLADASDRDVLVLNNPSPELVEQELLGRNLDLRLVKIVRDGRANTTSAIRYHPERYNSFYHALNGWLRPGWERVGSYELPGCGTGRWWRYEDFVFEPAATLAAVGEYVGLTYPEHAVRFWEFEHHPVTGNTGMIDTLLRLQGKEGFDHVRRPFSDQAVVRLMASPDRPVFDESWKAILTREDRFVYDYVAGDLHRAYGYEPDTFTEAERRNFLERLGVPADPSQRPETLRSPPEPPEAFQQRFQVGTKPPCAASAAPPVRIKRYLLGTWRKLASILNRS